MIALLIGFGGGMTRDVHSTQVLGALTNPAYITVAVAFGIPPTICSPTRPQFFREGLFQFVICSFGGAFGRMTYADW